MENLRPSRFPVVSGVSGVARFAVQIVKDDSYIIQSKTIVKSFFIFSIYFFYGETIVFLCNIYTIHNGMVIAICNSYAIYMAVIYLT